MLKTILIRILCFAVCILLIWQGYGVFENLAEKRNVVEGVEWIIPLSSDFDREAQDEYIIQKKLKKIGLDLVTKQEKQNYTLYSSYKTYLGVKDKEGKVIIQPKYSYIWIDEEKKYIMAIFHNVNDEDKGIYADLKNKVHYYNFDGSDYVKGDYCEGWFFEDGYAAVGVPCEESEDMYFKKKLFVINEKGEIAYESPYSNVCTIPGLKGYFIVYNNTKGHGLGMRADDQKGIINMEGKIILPLEYFSIEPCEEQQVIYLTKIDENNGNRLLYCMDYQFNPIEVNEVWEFRENNRFEYVNPIENSIDDKPQETMAKEDIFKNARTVYEDEKGWHIVNGNKETIADFPDCIKMYNFSEGISVVEYKNKIAYADISGNVLLEIKKPKDYELEEEYNANRCWYGTIQFAEHKSSFFGKDYKIGLLDKTGKVLLPAEFDYIEVININGDAKEAIVEKNGHYGVVQIM